jgi:hypothetical protein|tara:strand:- start:154 stop:636 length:483 start_codon:yes stop_codon:yes gene_type:complete
MNPKPKMETISDQKREERVAGFIEGLWDVRCNKLPVSYGLDYWCESSDSCFWLEVKCRSFGIDRYDTLLLSTSKLRMGAALSLATGHPFVLVFAMTDSVYSHTWKAGKEYDVRFGTIAEPIYEEDSEPYVHLSKDEMTCLSEHPLGFDREEMGLTYNKKG